MSSKIFMVSSIAFLLSTGAVIAEDASTTSTTEKKEGMSKKAEHVPGAMMKDTESGVKKVGHGTKKLVTGTGHEMGKMTHMGHHKKKAMPASDTAGASSGTTSDPNAMPAK